jgi:hypothetical protein
MVHLILTPIVPPRELWIDARGVRVEVVDGLIRVIPTAPEPLRVQLSGVAGVDGPALADSQESVF